MTQPFKVLVEGDRFEFQTHEQVEHFINQLEQKAKAEGLLRAVEVSLDDSTAMLITVGGAESYTGFYTAGARPPIATALGPHDDDTLIEFDTMGELSQMERRYWIPIEDAREALKHYLVTGMRSEKLRWNRPS